jgi:hypothetical protein
MTLFTLVAQDRNWVSKFASLLTVLAVVASAAGPLLAFPQFAYAAAEVHIVSINGQPPGHCLAGTLTVVVSGMTGDQQGGPYSVLVGNGFSTSSPVSVGTKNTPFTNVAIVYTPTGAGTNLYVNLYHGSPTGNDSHITVVNQCIPPPTKGVLKVTKHVASGTALASAFSLHVKLAAVDVTGSPAAGSETGTDYQLLPGTYVVSEDAVASYSQTSLVCHNDSDNADIVGASVVLVAGKNYSCTITNDFIPPTTGGLTVVKVLPNDSGGTAVAGDWTYKVGNAVVTAGQSNQFAGGPYTVTETGGPAGYAAIFTGDCDSVGQVTVVNGESKTCTITNDDQPATFTVTKVVYNNYRGTSVVGDFDLFVGITEVFSAISNLFNAGGYTVSETGPTAGYHAVFSGDCALDGSVTLALGAIKTCTITNSDKEPGVLHVIKNVINDEPEGYTGTAVAGDFTLSVTGGNPDPSSFAGSESGVDVTIDAGTSYSVSETGGPVSSYGVSYSAGCSGTMAEGGEATCTVTNDDNPSTTGGLTVIKVLPNDNGGTAVAGDWTYKVGETTVTAGQNTQFAGDTYTVTETGGPSGYVATFSGDCDGSGVVTIENGVSKTCTITNDDEAATLIIVKNTISGDGIFVFGITGQDNASITTSSGTGTTQVTLDAGDYDVVEAVPAGWTLNSISCEYDNDSVGESIQNGKAVTLDPGDSVTCTFTDTRQFGSLVVKKTVINDSGTGTATSSDFQIYVKEGDVDVAGSPAAGTPDGTVYDLPTGTYALTESGPSGYAGSIGGDCSSEGIVIVPNDGTVTCTIINDDNPAQVSPPTGGGGGGGGGGGDGGNGAPIGSLGGGFGGAVLGASTQGQVLGVSCGLSMDQYLRRGSSKNRTGQVSILQGLLNKYLGAGLPTTGFFGPMTEGAVKAFQNKYAADILAPWGITSPTGLAYLTTLRKINLLECPDLVLAVPALIPWSKNPSAQ